MRLNEGNVVPEIRIFVFMKFPDSGVFINKLNNLFNGLIALPLLLVGFGYLEITSGSWTALMVAPPALLVSTVVGLGLLVIYLSLRFKKETRSLAVFDTVQEKMVGYYRLATFYYWSVFALAILTTVFLYLFAHVAYAVVYAFILFWMSVFRPTLTSLAKLFDLQDDERRKFINKEELDQNYGEINHQG